jgi:hypothetical protein
MLDYPLQLNTLEFKAVINELVADCDEIVETGTFQGNGSTKIFAETGKYVFTMECNPMNHQIATQNLAQYENVIPFHALSMKRETLIKFLLNEKFDIATEYDSKFPKTFYMREVGQNVLFEDGLNLLCNNDRKQLIFLDSAGGVGYAEFMEVMSFHNDCLKNKIIMLDDIQHIKHCRSVAKLLEMGQDVHISAENRFAWCYLKF